MMGNSLSKRIETENSSLSYNPTQIYERSGHIPASITQIENERIY